MLSRTAAVKLYHRRLAVTMTIYVAGLFGANWAIGEWRPEGVALVLVSLVPALAIVGVIGVIGLYLLDETDEYIRRQVATAMLVGLGFMLSLATIWGFLEDTGAVGHIPSFYAFVVWCAGWSLAQCGFCLRDRFGGDRA